MIVSSHGIIGSQITQFVGLLDAYPSAAAAYSLRKLRSAYTGSAIRVRRASDSEELDIEFSANELDTSALTTFCSGTNGFVKTWYDQSGNARDATQTTAANQPQIVSSGSVILENGKPCIVPDGITQSLLFSTISAANHYISVVGGNTTKGRFLGDSGGYAHFIDSGVASNRFRINGTIYNLTSRILQNQQLLSWSRVGATSNLYNNTSLNTNNTIITSNFIIGQMFINASDITTCSDGKFQEIIIYTSDESANRTGIEDNINDFYSIF